MFSIERLEKDETNLLDIREKKTDKFPQSYFDILLNMIKRILDGVLLILFILQNKLNLKMEEVK